MFNLVPPVSVAYSQFPNGMTEERPIELRQLLQFLKSNALLIGAVTASFLLAAVIYLMIVPATFTSGAQLILDSPISGSSADIQQLRTEEAFVEGQIEIMRSTDVLRSVVRSQALGSDPEFVSTRLSPGDVLRAMAFKNNFASADSADNDGVDEARENLTIAILRGRLWVRRVGQSSVIDISASSTSPVKAAMIANAIAEAYMATSLDRRAEKARHASQWLSERVKLIKEDVFAAERAVREFQASGSPESRFRLAQLQSEADSYRKVYESYLQRWFETAQQISNPVGKLASSPALPSRSPKASRNPLSFSVSSSFWGWEQGSCSRQSGTSRGAR
ncbi:Wzz/FepE/Etk N-terminal domain-containing protein (plasmid) [Aliirhizobium terrae]|uniref:GumC family protein n=1 Tax=Terrirhizobium terrae TaxID=2926709 RepID=UPI0025772ACE|nr:Wzz/FepE/Etk N-terminal domain-containing protein [Rhizobium sp. CC-CFT758]WJH38083.1 Wzz/FepE/Etk N-terminal domain-containing protein [Rhizobium sp. CC-CFT758]